MGSEARFQIINGVVAGNPTFYPGYIKQNGEYCSPHLVTGIYVNHDNYNRGGVVDPNAKQKPASLFELVIWGDKPCAVGAHWWNQGKTLTFRGRMESTKLAVKNNANEMIMQISTGRETDPETKQAFIAGTSIPIYRWRQSFIIEKFHFGGDSAKTRQERNHLFPGWEVEGSGQGYINWQAEVARLKASQNAGYHGGDSFGIAKIGRVNGQLAVKDAAGNVSPLGNTVVGGQPQQFVQPGMQAGALNPNAQAQPTNMGMPNTTAAPQFVPVDAQGRPLAAPVDANGNPVQPIAGNLPNTPPPKYAGM